MASIVDEEHPSSELLTVIRRSSEADQLTCLAVSRSSSVVGGTKMTCLLRGGRVNRGVAALGELEQGTGEGGRE